MIDEEVAELQAGGVDAITAEFNTCVPLRIQIGLSRVLRFTVPTLCCDPDIMRTVSICRTRFITSVIMRGSFLDSPACARMIDWRANSGMPVSLHTHYYSYTQKLRNQWTCVRDSCINYPAQDHQYHRKLEGPTSRL